MRFGALLLVLPWVCSAHLPRVVSFQVARPLPRTTTTRHRRHSSKSPLFVPDAAFAVPGACTWGVSSLAWCASKIELEARQLLQQPPPPSSLAFVLGGLGGFFFSGARYHNEQTRLDSLSEMEMRVQIGMQVEMDSMLPKIIAAPMGGGVEMDPNFAKTDAGVKTVCSALLCSSASSFVLQAVGQTVAGSRF